VSSKEKPFLKHNPLNWAQSLAIPLNWKQSFAPFWMPSFLENELTTLLALHSIGNRVLTQTLTI